MAKQDQGVVAIGMRVLSDMISLRSAGETISWTARHLGLAPWHVSYLTRFVKVCVSYDEFRLLTEEAERWGWSTVGEFIMDVFNRHYEKDYVPAAKRRRAAERRKAAA